MPDPTPDATKRHRLTEAFLAQQNRDGTSRRIVTFITRAMNPVSYLDRPELFALRQDRLNEVLTFEGLHVNVTTQGQFKRGPQAATLDQTGRFANSVRDELRRRSTHTQVLDYCTVEVLKRDHFHAVFEASKSIFERLRTISGLTGDGAKLVDDTLTLGKTCTPVIAINTLQSQTDRDEQTGFATLIKAINSLYRNPAAHDPRLFRAISRAELLEAVTMISMVHRRLDEATQPQP